MSLHAHQTGVRRDERLRRCETVWMPCGPKTTCCRARVLETKHYATIEPAVEERNHETTW